jgi:hypothetical protein
MNAEQVEKWIDKNEALAGEFSSGLSVVPSYKLIALFAGKVLVPVDALSVDWVNANVAMPDTVKGRVMAQMFWHGVYAAIAALQEQKQL